MVERRRGTLVAALAATLVISTLVCWLCFNQMMPPPQPEFSGTRKRRWLSYVDSVDLQDCELSPASYSQTPIQPVLLASYPGSGSQMTRNLMSQLTGLHTESIWSAGTHDRVVAIKTHYPFSGEGEHLELLENRQFDRAILVMRSPLHAIPSFFNQIYEKRHGLPSHTQRGTEEEWIKFRDNPQWGFEHNVNQYELMITHWMEQFSLRNRLLIVTYETLVNERSGPTQSMRIAEWLQRTEGVEAMNEQFIPCIWEKVVMSRGWHGEAGEDGLVPERPRFTLKETKRKGRYRRSFTDENLQDVMDMLRRLRDRYQYDPQLVSIVEQYMQECTKMAMRNAMDNLE